MGKAANRHLRVAIGVALLIGLAGCGSAGIRASGSATTIGGQDSSTTGPSPGRSDIPTTSRQTTPAAVSTTAACTRPLVHALDDGFHVAVPDGWDLSTLNGEAIVAQTPAQTTAVLVYPALLTNGLTASSFFNTYLSKLDQENAAAGAPVTTDPATGADGFPAVDFTQTVNGTSLHGYATVKVLPLAAPGATHEAAYIAYWAPAGSFADSRSELASVAACYGPESATPSRVFQDHVFTYAIPPGWSPFDENANGIDLHGPDDSDVSYILAGPVATSEFDSPQTMVTWFLNGVGISGVTSLSSVASRSQQASNGGTESDLYEEFTGRSGGNRVQGLIFSYTVIGGGVSSGYIRMAVAPTADWNLLNPSMIQIAGSIQHNFSQDLATLQHVNQQWQDFSGQVADFDDTLNNQQLVKDPSTGVYYEAPYAAYDQNGPRGPGYYLNNGEELNPVSRT